MKRVLAWFAGLVGIAALGRWLAGRNRAGGPPPAPLQAAAPSPAPPVDAAEATGDDPAEELRRKLAAAREPGPTAVAAPAEETLDERRARVHAKAREAIDAMADDRPEA